MKYSMISRAAAVVCLLVLGLAGCGGPETTGSGSQKKPDPKSPEAIAVAEAQQWMTALPSWNLLTRQRFVSEGHQGVSLEIYANEAANDVAAESHPPGSVYAARGFGSAEATAPDKVWVMIKMDPGYDPEHHDWLYVELDGTGAVQ